MSDVAVHHPSPAKRGRGRGRGGAGRGGASARARGKPAVRRGRAKFYDNSRAQAAHERQRDLKNNYASLAAAMKPALEELADRNLDRLRSFDAEDEVREFAAINSQLKNRFDKVAAGIARELKLITKACENELTANTEAYKSGYQVCIFQSSLLNYAALIIRPPMATWLTPAPTEQNCGIG